MKLKVLIFISLSIFVFSGFCLASEAENEVIISTALARPTSLHLSITPSAVPMELRNDNSIVNAQANIALPGLRPSPKRGKALFDANLVAMVGLNIADYLSTREALKYPGLCETNPLMKPFVKHPAAFAAIKFGTTALTYFSMKAIFKKNKTVAWVLTTATNFLLSYVVANNLQQIQKAKMLR